MQVFNSFIGLQPAQRTQRFDTRDQICSSSPALKTACDSGLRWLVFNWACPIVWPGFADLVQSALNTTASKRQTEVEVIIELGRLRDIAISKGCSPDWDSIQDQATSQQPACAGYISTLALYVKEQAPELIQELSLFAKAFASNDDKACGSDFFSKLNALNFGKCTKKPHIIHAALCTNLSAPANKITDGICKLIPPSSLPCLVAKGSKDMCTVYMLYSHGVNTIEACFSM